MKKQLDINDKSGSRYNLFIVRIVFAATSMTLFTILSFYYFFPLSETIKFSEIEDNRISNPFGFSIITPKNWKSKSFCSTDTNDLHLASTIIRTTSGQYQSISVEVYANKPKVCPPNPRPGESWDVQKIDFLGRPTERYEYNFEGVRLDQPQNSGLRYCFQIEDFWFVLVFHQVENGKYAPEWVEKCFHTFKYCCPCPELLSSVPNPQDEH